MPLSKNSKYQAILKAGVLYLATGWLIVQIAMSLTPVFGWPPIFAFGILFMLIPGYPIVMMMAWAFEMTHKDKGWDKADDERQAKGGGKGFQIAVGILAGLAMAVMLLDVFFLVDSAPEEQRVIPAPQTQ
jgi:hypothetical protein